MCDAMREKLAALLRSAVCAPAQPHSTDKLQNGAVEPVLLFRDDEGLVTLYFRNYISSYFYLKFRRGL